MNNIINSKDKVPVIRGMQRNPVVSKLVLNPDKTNQLQGYEGKQILDEAIATTLSEKITRRSRDYRDIMQALPDTKLAMEIWASCIATPKDGLTESIIWTVPNNTEYSADLYGKLVTVLKEYFEREYDLFGLLKPAIEDSLFKTGSYILAVIPESSLDDIINGKTAISKEMITNVISTETRQGLGYLGNKQKTHSFESLIHNSTNTVYNPKIHNNLYVSDDPEILKMHLVSNKLRKDKSRNSLRQRYHHGLESVAKLDYTKQGDTDTTKLTHEENLNITDKSKVFDPKVREETVKKLYREREYRNQPIVSVPGKSETTRLPEGKPLIYQLPSESVIPVHVPSKPDQIIGCFVILDESYYPVSRDAYNDMFDKSREESQENIAKAKSLISELDPFANDCCGDKNGKETLNNLARVYTSLVENDLITRLASGLYGEAVELAHTDEIYRIMFHRALQAMRTQILYIPEELITYFAFDYDKNGIGISLLEDVKQLATMRAAMQSAEMYAELMNSISRRKLVITPDEADPNPMNSIEKAIQNYTRVSAFNIPLISGGITDVINTLRGSAVDVVIEGNNPLIPTMTIDVEDTELQRKVPDEALRDRTRNLMITAMGLPATAMDETQNTEFATNSLLANSLFNKRVLGYQIQIARNLLYDHVVKVSLASGDIIRVLSEVIKDNTALLTPEQRQYDSTIPIIEHFLDSLDISLPTPGNTGTESKSEDFNKYKDFVDTFIEAMYSDDLLQASLPEDLRDKTSIVREMLKSIMINDYVKANNYLPELNSIISSSNPEDTVEAKIVAILKPISEMATKSVIALDKVSKVTNDPALSEINIEDSGSDDYGSGDDNSDDNESDDEFGGSDDDFDDGLDDNSDSDDSDDDDDSEGSEDEDKQDDDLGF